MGKYEYCEVLLGNVYVDDTKVPYYVRLGTIVVIILMHLIKKKLVVRSDYKGSKSLMLPIYFKYFICLLVVESLIAFIDIVLERTVINSIFVSALIVAAYDMFSDGICFFLMQHGAGQIALQRAIFFSCMWGLVIFMVFSFIFMWQEEDEERNAFYLYTCFTMFVLGFYSLFVILPLDVLYRRPGTTNYAKFKIVANLCYLFLAALIHIHIEICFCVAYCFRILVFAITPYVVLKLLEQDSDYWQGFGDQINNPIVGAFDTIQGTTSDALRSIEKTGLNRLPFIHFGQIEFKKNNTYVSGGLSRVYFGKMKSEEVAIKFLFAIELNPKIVQQFYDEVRVLYSVQHPNIVKCYGLSVMPPAVCVILEYCSYGSLFQYLHDVMEEVETPLVNNLFHMMSKPTSDRDSGLSLENISNISTGIQKGSNPDFAFQNSSLALDRNRSHTSASQNILQTEESDHVNVNSKGYRIRSTPHIRLDVPNSSVSSPLQTVLNNNNTSQKSVDTPDRSSLSQNTHRTINATLSDMFVHHPANAAQYITRSSITSGKDDFTNNEGNISVSRDSLAATRNSFLASAVTSLLPNPFKTHHNTTSLNQKLKARSFTMLEKFQMVKDCASGVAFLHNMGYMHCDMKSLNYLVNHSGIVKLADLGEARETISSVIGASAMPNPARNWAPPETLDIDISQRFYVPASDVYGLAIVITEIFSQQIPLDEESRTCSPAEWFRLIAVLGVRPFMPMDLPLGFSDLIAQAWSFDPLCRPSASVIADRADDCIKYLTAPRSSLFNEDKPERYSMV